MYLAADPFEGPVVLGRITAAHVPTLVAGEQYVIQAWREKVDGRKLHTAAAIYDASGATIACARMIWVRLRSSITDEAKPAAL